ncbi:MAG: hypothetical protein ACN6I3_00410 [bacterium]
MTIKKNHHASIRIGSENPDHHLYNNNGTWWLHYTAYPTPASKERVRCSLRTRELVVARKRRDVQLEQLFQTENVPHEK